MSQKEAAEVAYVQRMFFGVLTSIRYSKDTNPHYAGVTVGVKLQATAELDELAKLAGEYFYTTKCANAAKNWTKEAIEDLKAEAIGCALQRLEEQKAGKKPKRPVN
jgi:hypothetical protein